MKMMIRMHAAIANASTHLHQKALDLLLRPAQTARTERRIRKRRDALEPVALVQRAEPLHARVARPGVDGQLFDALMDVDVAGVAHPAGDLGGKVDAPFEEGCGAVIQAHPVEKTVAGADGRVVRVRVGGDAVVVAAERHLELVALEVAARFEITKSVADHALVRLERAKQDGGVDQVEVVGGPEPVFLHGVVDVEVHVLGDGGGLDGGEIGGVDFGVGV